MAREEKNWATLTLLTLFSGFLRIFLVAAGGQAKFGATTFIIFDCCCDNCDVDVEFVVLLGGIASVIHDSGRASSRGPSLRMRHKKEEEEINC